MDDAAAGTGLGTGSSGSGSGASSSDASTPGDDSSPGSAISDASMIDDNLGTGGVTDATAPKVGGADGGPSFDPNGSDLDGGPVADPANLKYCTGTSPIHCFFGGTNGPAAAVGNYDVSFVLGGPNAGKTSVEAEMHRPILPQQDTTAGQTKRYSFTINVRWPEGEPQEPFQHGLPAGAPQYGVQGLELLFNGLAPALTSIGVAPAASSDIVLYVAGDSTVCDQYGYPTFAGYGQVLPQIFHLGVSVANYADSGESSSSFLGNGKLWKAILAAVKPNDVVFIEFGHNDNKGTPTTAAQFHANMTKYVTDTLAAKAIPVLLTPIARADGRSASQQLSYTAGGGTVSPPAIIRTVGMEQNVPVIDLTAATSAWLQQVGPNGWQAYHAPGDGTHTNAAGAAINVGFIRDAIVKMNIMPLARYVR